MPVFGICYGFQAMAQALGGEVARTGAARVRPDRRCTVVDADGDPARRPAARAQRVDEPRRLRHRGAGGLRRRSRRRRRRPVAAFEDVERRLAGVQCHPEVLHTEHGQQVLEHFLYDIAGCRPTWTHGQHRRGAGRAHPRRRSATGRVICGLSGGVDSAVAAAARAARGRRPADLRLRRPRAAAQGRGRAGRAGLRRRDRRRARTSSTPQERFLDALAGVTDPEEKRKIIGREFIRVFEAAEAEVVGRAGRARRAGRVPRPGHALPRRRRVRRRHRHGQHQVPPQRRRAARRPAVRAGRAAAHAVQGRGARGRASSSACPRRSSGGSRSPGPGLGIRIIGEVTARAARHAARGRRDRPRGARPRPASTATSGSARSCCWPTSARSASRATAAPTATRSCCARSPPRTR